MFALVKKVDLEISISRIKKNTVHGSKFRFLVFTKVKQIRQNSCGHNVTAVPAADRLLCMRCLRTGGLSAVHIAARHNGGRVSAAAALSFSGRACTASWASPAIT